jgi:uncharacterized membrane protein YagU involved in acid resistance
LNPFAGISFGLLVWAISYLGLLPALGLYPSPRKDTGRRTAIMVLAHIVWGAMLGTTVKLLQKSGDEASSMSGVGQISRLWQR